MVLDGFRQKNDVNFDVKYGQLNRLKNSNKHTKNHTRAVSCSARLVGRGDGWTPWVRQGLGLKCLGRRFRPAGRNDLGKTRSEHPMCLGTKLGVLTCEV